MTRRVAKKVRLHVATRGLTTRYRCRWRTALRHGDTDSKWHSSEKHILKVCLFLARKLDRQRGA